MKVFAEQFCKFFHDPDTTAEHLKVQVLKGSLSTHQIWCLFSRACFSHVSKVFHTYSSSCRHAHDWCVVRPEWWHVSMFLGLLLPFRESMASWQQLSLSCCFDCSNTWWSHYCRCHWHRRHYSHRSMLLSVLSGWFSSRRRHFVSHSQPQFW